MDLGLTGRTAVVTGASEGIGLAVVKALAAEGVRVTAGAQTVGGLHGVDPAAVAEQAMAGAPTGRFSTADEVAALVVMAASDRAGADFVIDGGLVSTL